MDDGSMTPEDQADNDMDYDENCEENSYSNGSSSSFSPDKLASPLQHKLDLSASPTRSDGVNPRVEHLIALFKDLSSTEQMETFTRLLDESNMANLRHLRAKIEPHFQRDFLSCLPVELGMKIINNLSGKDLMRVAHVSRNWRFMSEVDKIWKNLSEDDYYLYPEPSDRVNGAWHGTALSGGVSIPEHMNPDNLTVHRFLKLQKYGE
uniref:F-box domain-containing protein n=1 Tax=Caenorhabditis japonica TaxID=281687 RepID=A0A8R1IFM4_CAEJA